MEVERRLLRRFRAQLAVPGAGQLSQLAQNAPAAAERERQLGGPVPRAGQGVPPVQFDTPFGPCDFGHIALVLYSESRRSGAAGRAGATRHDSFVLPCQRRRAQTAQGARLPGRTEVTIIADRRFRSDMTVIERIQDFLGQKRLAIVGVSRQPKDFSRAVLREFREKGYDAVPVNPAAREMDRSEEHTSE